MSRRRPKVKGMSRGAAFTLPSGRTIEPEATAGPKPKCSKGHPANRMIKDETGWVCLDCFDAFLVEHNPGGIANRTKSGIIVPKGTRNPDALTSAEIFGPNREARRQHGKSESSA